MEKYGHGAADFAGFMSDEAGANWNAIRTVFNGGPDNIMEGRERSCLFHWEQSLHKYVKKWIPQHLTSQHIDMCEEWRACKTIVLASQKALSIQKWWRQHLSTESITRVSRWFKWWEQRISHWGGIGTDVSTFMTIYIFSKMYKLCIHEI